MLRPSAVAAAVVCLALAPTAGAEVTGTVVAEYSGTLDSTFVYQQDDPAVWQAAVHFTWDEKTTVRLMANDRAVPVGKPVLEVTGKTTSTYAPPNTANDCTGTFSPRPGLPKERFPISVSVVGDTEATSASITAILPVGGDYTQSSAPDESDCGVHKNGSVNHVYFPSDNYREPVGGPLTPGKDIRLGDLPFSHHFKEDYKDPGSGIETNIDATLTISGSGRGSKPPPNTPGRFRAKANAVKALKTTWERSLYPCIATAAATPLGAAGPAGQVAAAVIVGVGGVLCTAYIKAENDEIATFEDPPIDSYHRIAQVGKPKRRNLRLPDCSKYDASTRSFCMQLEADVKKLIPAVQRTGAVAAAMATTIGRETAAIKHHDKRATRRQDRALTQLSGELSKAEVSETAAGAAVARLMRAAGLSAGLDVSQSQQAITKVSKALAKRGISHKKLASGVGSLLTPAPLDWLAALSA